MYTIVRIEHSDGYGMFRIPYEDYECKGLSYSDRYRIGQSEDTWEMYERHHTRKNPYRDGIDISNDMFCAFDSLETFNALVTPEEVKFLLTKDFKVLMMEVTRVEKGEHQVCYRKEDVISTKDISSLF